MVFENLKNDLSKIEQIALKNKKDIKGALDKKQQLEKKIADLRSEQLNYEAKSFLAKAFSRGHDAINAEILNAEPELKKYSKSVLSLSNDLEKLNRDKQRILSQISKAETRIIGENLKKSQQIIAIEDAKVSSLNSSLAELKKKIEDLRKTILSGASVIGATLTKSFLSPSDLGKFQNTVIDEASMGLLPAVYFTASQSSNRCIISGDFRQLPPIVQSKNKTIIDIIGSDIFSVSGLEKIFSSKRECDYADVLKEQYRMHPKICALISEIGYEGELYTSEKREGDKTSPPKIFREPVIIIDTSPIYPFTDRDPFGSTSNLVHALIARNIMREFSKSQKSGTIGYCSPFKAQTKLMKKIASGEAFEDSTIGTVHTFQGDEKNTIIFDTVNSLGEKYNINLNLAQETAQKSNLLTVAISRAQHRLIFIANLRYLDDKIPAQGYLRKILYEAQRTGSVIDARDIIDLAPLRHELDKSKVTIKDLNITEQALKSGLINEDTFFPLLKVDLEKAKKFIAIYTGFYTANRVNDLLLILTQKIKQGIQIRVILPPPDKNGSMRAVDSAMVVEKLEIEGILVEFRARIHQKAVLIDENIAWFGSLNPLSFSGATEESMLRIEQKNITGTFAANMAVNRNSAKDDPALMVVQELPSCSFCGSKTIFNRGRYGAYVDCISCRKKETLKSF